MAEKEYKRVNDEKIDELVYLVKEIHQRQTEITIPKIKEIEETLYGTDKKSGLCKQVSVMESALVSSRWFVGLVMSLVGLFFVFMEFIF